MSGSAGRRSDAVLVGVNRHTDVGQDKSGRSVTLFAFTPEQTEALIQALNKSKSESGTLIRLATELKTTNDGKRQFPSSFLMVMEDRPKDAKGGYPKKDTFKPKATGYQQYGNKGYKPQTRLTEEE